MIKALYASFPEHTKGRLFPESPTKFRTEFQRDRDRIIHSTAFRRLEYKTQVFINHDGDHYRTRLTHSLEVAQIGRSIARLLKVDEDLTEAVALAHDLGHTPFGHAGERALNALMKDEGGFDHNSQTLKILTKLEQCYTDFDGLNLTWETLEGVVKHHGRWEDDPIRYVKEYNEISELRLSSFSSLEGQIANIADDIAYNNHDMDDGLRADMFSIEDISEVPMVGEVFAEVKKEYPHLMNGNPTDQHRLIHEAVRRIITKMIVDLLEETEIRLLDYGIKTVEDIRQADCPMAAFSDKMERASKELKTFLRDNMYNHPRVHIKMEEAQKVVQDLYHYFYNAPEQLPLEWQHRIAAFSPSILGVADDPHPNPLPERNRERSPNNGRSRAEVIGDFIAGMTDRYALQMAEKIG